MEFVREAEASSWPENAAYWFEMIAIGGYALLAYLFFRLLIKMAHNYKAQQFWKQKFPHLNVLPNVNIFHGHANTFIYTSRNWKKIDDLAKVSGKFVGAYYVDKQAIGTIDLEFIKTFAIDEADHHNERPFLNLPFKEFAEDNLTFAKGEQWKRLRKITAPAISSLRFKAPNVQAEMNDVVEEFCTAIDNMINKANSERGENYIEPNVDDMSHRFAYAIVFSCFYKQRNVIDFEAEKEYFAYNTDQSMREVVGLPLKLAIMFPVLKPLINYLMMQFTTAGHMTNYVMDLIKQQTKLHLDARKHLEDARKAGIEIDPDDFVLEDGRRFQRNMSDYVIDHFYDGKMSEREYLHSMFLLFMSSEGTTSDAIAKVMYHLAVHQDVQAKLRQSILSEGMDCEYMQWVFFESMRLFPPLLLGASRILGRDVHTQSIGLIPGNTYVITPTYTIHRWKEYWGDDADEFKPERWRNAKDFHPAQYMAFGLGKRGCPGKEMAIREMRMLFDALLRRFKFETCAKTSDPNEFDCPIMLFRIADSPNHIRISRF